MWALERSGIYKGHYHVLGGVLSAIDGVNPDDLNIPTLEERISISNEIEVISAEYNHSNNKLSDHSPLIVKYKLS